MVNPLLVINLKQELQFKSNQLNDLRSQVETNTAQLKQTSEEIVQSEQQQKEIEEGLYALMRRRETEEHTLNEADQHYYNLRNQLSAKESELRHKVKEKEIIEHL